MFFLIWDLYFSPYAGGEDLLLAHHLVEWAEERLIKDAGPSWPAKIGRFSELVLFWYPVNYLAMLTQHEVFGHGFRVRDIDHARVNKYNLGRPPPYGWGGAATIFTIDTSKVTVFQDMAIRSGGVEATAILANRLKLKWLEQGALDPKTATLYLESQQDLTEYISQTQNEEEIDGGHDIEGYVHLLNRLYPRDHLSLKKLKAVSLINLLDPFSYYAIFAWWRYVNCGKEGPIPMFKMGDYKYLPGARLGLTPFGPEYYIENYLVKECIPSYFYFRWGNHAHQTYLGAGFENSSLWKGLGLRLDAWIQPNVPFESSTFSIRSFEKHFKKVPRQLAAGFAGSLIVQKEWFFGQFGGKTKGYLPGESLEASFILRLGLAFFGKKQCERKDPQ